MTKITGDLQDKIEENSVERNDDGTFKDGVSGNPDGRKPGSRNFKTIYQEALIKIAENQNMTPDEFEDMLVQSGMTRAFKGDFRFFKDIMDRLHGRAVQAIDHSSGGKPIRNNEIVFRSFRVEKDDDTSSK